MVAMDYVFLFALLTACAFVTYTVHEISEAIRSYLD